MNYPKPEEYKNARRHVIDEQRRCRRDQRLEISMGGETLLRTVKVPAARFASAYARIYGQEVAIALVGGKLVADRIVTK
jgi:hypothetical protein